MIQQTSNFNGLCQSSKNDNCYAPVTVVAVIIFKLYLRLTTAMISFATALNTNWENWDYLFNISNLCWVRENIGICDYSHLCNIDSCVGSSSSFTRVEPWFEMHFSTKGNQLLTKQFSTHGLHNTVSKVQLNPIDYGMKAKLYVIVWQDHNYNGI